MVCVHSSVENIDGSPKQKRPKPKAPSPPPHYTNTTNNTNTTNTTNNTTNTTNTVYRHYRHYRRYISLPWQMQHQHHPPLPPIYHRSHPHYHHHQHCHTIGMAARLYNLPLPFYGPACTQCWRSSCRFSQLRCPIPPLNSTNYDLQLAPELRTTNYSSPLSRTTNYELRHAGPGIPLPAAAEYACDDVGDISYASI